jgi:endonuclease YncB( thermonuclease family)
VLIEDDVNKFDEFGQRYGYPVVRGSDGNLYNISALLIYVGMARYIPDLANTRHGGWLAAAEVWARTACWNMWDGGNPWAGESGCR